MADFTSTDLSGIYGSGAMANKDIKIQKKGANMDLNMTDFIQLMITQLTNQGIDESVDTSDMLNQMIQMQMVETIATLTDASVMSYAASLVGQMVTVGKYDSEGNLQEVYGQVTGTGTMNGNQVVFIDNGDYYQMSEILAVGKLPPKKEEDDKAEDTEKPGETPAPTDPGKTENTQRPEGSQESGGTQTSGGTEQTGTVESSQGTAGTGDSQYGGESGTPDDQGA